MPKATFDHVGLTNSHTPKLMTRETLNAGRKPVLILLGRSTFLMFTLLAFPFPSNREQVQDTVWSEGRACLKVIRARNLENLKPSLGKNQSC